MEQNGDVTAVEVLDLLRETRERLEAADAELLELREHRGHLLLLGKDLGISIAEMARQVGMRREQAHYAIVKAERDHLERELEGSTA